MPPINVLKIKEDVKKLASMTPEQQLAFKKEAERQAINRADELLKKTQEENTKRVTDLKKQNRNRNLLIAGGMVVGAVGGFFIARYFKAKTLGLVLSTVGGSVAVGVPIILATRKKAVARRTEIETLSKPVASIPEVTQKVKDIFSKVEMQPKMETLKTTTIDQSKLPDTLQSLGSTETPKMA
jgi:F0F1-type ATP synthase assembly protein I